MKRYAFSATAVVGLSLLAGPALWITPLHAQSSGPVVFQAAGPTIASIQSMVDAFRSALGDNNGNTPGPLAAGRREINWDGGGSTATAVVPTPFEGFLVNRGARFTTSGDAFVQAPVEGLAATFSNPGYATFFQAFSPVRLFSPIGGNITNVRFFVPGGGGVAATTMGFGAIFSDVDRNGATTLQYFGVRGDVFLNAAVPTSRGSATLSFLGVVFPDARVARVRITTGNAAPGPGLGSTLDVVMMDDFIYGEPQAID